MFDEIKGQQKSVNILRNFIEKNRLPNSLLFYGPRGVGKFLTAKNLVKYFNCLNENPELKGSDNCNNCRRIDAEIFPDFYVIRQEKKQIKIEQIRELIKNINLKPFESKNKFFVIDDAETMNISSENSFLKTLEEPLPGNYIILICHNINSLLDTITSRCIKIRFSQLTPEVISQILIDKKNVDNDIARKVALISSGSMNKAIRLLEENNYEKIFSEFNNFVSYLSDRNIDIEKFENTVNNISKWEIENIEYELELLYVYFVELLLKRKYGIDRSEIFKNYLNVNIEHIKFSSYNLLLSYITEAKYDLVNTNANVKLLIEKLLLNIRNILFNESS